MKKTWKGRIQKWEHHVWGQWLARPPFTYRSFVESPSCRQVCNTLVFQFQLLVRPYPLYTIINGGRFKFIHHTCTPRTSTSHLERPFYQTMISVWDTYRPTTFLEIFQQAILAIADSLPEILSLFVSKKADWVGTSVRSEEMWNRTACYWFCIKLVR